VINLFQDQELKFPVKWHYKIITFASRSDSQNEIISILRSHGVDKIPTPGHSSKNGKYLTYNVTVTFYDKESMENLSSALSRAECVRFLL
jgi:putative lipoic acid-binding regulatory protein